MGGDAAGGGAQGGGEVGSGALGSGAEGSVVGRGREVAGLVGTGGGGDTEEGRGKKSAGQQRMRFWLAGLVTR